MKDGEIVERCIAYAAPTKRRPSGHRVRKQAMIDPRTGETKSRKPTFRGPNSLEEARAYRAGIELALKTGENLEQYLGPIDKNEIVRVVKKSVPERPVVWKATDDTEAPLTIRKFVEQHELARIDEFNSKGDHGQKLAAAKFYLPIFGRRYIDDIKPHEIDEFAYHLQRQRKDNGEPYSKSTLKKYFNCFRTICRKMAKRADIQNPADVDLLEFDLKRFKGARKKSNRVTKPELVGLLLGLKALHMETLDPEKKHLHQFRGRRARWYYAGFVQSLTGLRPSQLAFLRKQDLLFDERDTTFSLRLAGGIVDGEVGPTKKGKLKGGWEEGVQYIPLSRPAAEHIQEWLEIRTDLGFADVERIFTKRDGSPIKARMLRDAYYKASDRYWRSNGVEETADLKAKRVMPKALRHSLNSLLHRLNASPLDVESYLGHEDAETNKIYFDKEQLEGLRAPLDEVGRDFLLLVSDDDSGSTAQTGRAVEVLDQRAKLFR